MNVQNISTAGAGYLHHLLEEKHPHVLVYMSYATLLSVSV